jgi:hypothetical protein
MIKPVYQKITRQVTDRDFAVLNFLWQWKLASTQAIAKKFYSDVQPMNAQLRLRQLAEVGFVDRIKISKRHSAWCLGKKGYGYIRDYMSEDIHHGYRADYPRHDFITSAFHLGEWLTKMPPQAEVYSEQELRCNIDEFWPAWVPQSNVHRPDGYSRYMKDEKQILAAFENELTLKSKSRYEDTVHFYESESSIDFVFWIVTSANMIGSIGRIFAKYGALQFAKHNFILLPDFLRLGWNAVIQEGCDKGKMLSDVIPYSNITSAKQWHHARDVDSLLDTRRTPGQSIIYDFDQKA